MPDYTIAYSFYFFDVSRSYFFEGSEKKKIGNQMKRANFLFSLRIVDAYYFQKNAYTDEKIRSLVRVVLIKGKGFIEKITSSIAQQKLS